MGWFLKMNWASVRIQQGLSLILGPLWNDIDKKLSALQMNPRSRNLLTETKDHIFSITRPAVRSGAFTDPVVNRSVQLSSHGRLNYPTSLFRFATILLSLPPIDYLPVLSWNRQNDTNCQSTKGNNLNLSLSNFKIRVQWNSIILTRHIYWRDIWSCNLYF
jgi:hypothetical protein